VVLPDHVETAKRPCIACDASRPLTLEEMVTNALRVSGRPSTALGQNRRASVAEALCGEVVATCGREGAKSKRPVKFEFRGTRLRDW
jgi:hypothetical protein